jgi:hypothetical protein
MNIETVIGLLDKSKNDNEKFALLLIVSQLIKSNKLDDLKRNDNETSKELNERLFNSIGSHFLARLLTTRQQTENCSPLFYKSTSMSILIQFLDYPDLICDPILISKLQIIFDILKCKEDYNTSSEDEEEKTTNLKLEKNLILDTLKYLFALSETCSDHLISIGLLNILINDVILNKSYNKFKIESQEQVDEDLKLIACKLFTSICNGKQSRNKNKDFDKFKLNQIEDCMKSLVKCVNKNQTDFKFLLLPYLNYFLDETINKQTFQLFQTKYEDFSDSMFNILNDLLSNKINPKMKQLAFVYLNHFVKLFQFEYIYMKNRKFFYLIIHLLCIEIGINIQQVESESKISIKNEFLDNMYIYYSLLEEIIVILSTASPFDYSSDRDNSDQDTDNDVDEDEENNKIAAGQENEEPELKKVIQIIVESLESIVMFVKDCLNDDKDYKELDKYTCLFLVSCIRLLNCWLMHENVLEKELIDLMPRLIDFSKYFHQSEFNQDLKLNVFEFITPSLKRVLSDERENFKDKFIASNNKTNEDMAKLEFEKSEQEEYINAISKLLDKCDFNVK